jgi:dextransucrase
VDGYLPVDGWYAAKDAATSDQYWKPLIMNYTKDTGYLSYMAKNGFASTDDIMNGDNGKIASLTNTYIQSQPEYGYGSEQKTYKNDNSGIDDSDQLMFVNEDGSSSHNIHNTISGNNEFLLGLDIDNSNPTVQKEQIHWMNWLLDTYKFDGFRVDAASNYDKQVLLDEADVMKEHFGSDLNNHISYIESYSDAEKGFEDSNGNPQLAMDYGLFYTLNNTLGKATPTQSLSTLETNSTVNRSGSGTSNNTPNWSFVTNHDQEKNRVNNVILGLYGIKTGEKYTNQTPKALDEIYDKNTEKKALQIYEADMQKTDKQYAPTNVESSYAYILTNKNTVPTVYYGDMYQTDGSYMAHPTLYYNVISKLLEARKDYAYGSQKVTSYTTNTSPKTAGKDLISSVRYGNDRNTGLATVIGNNPKTNSTIKVNMGSNHANQVFEDATGFHTEKLVTDNKGVLTIQVKGTASPQVKGYLGVWMPTKDKAPTLSWNAVKTVNQGKSIKAKIRLNHSASTIQSYTYSSCNNQIVQVDKYGNVKGGKKSGDADILVTVTTKDHFVLYLTQQVEVKANRVKR